MTTSSQIAILISAGRERRRDRFCSAIDFSEMLWSSFLSRAIMTVILIMRARGSGGQDVPT